MKRLYIACLLAVVSLNAHALGRLADVSIIDRDTGAAIATHYYKGEYWIAGRPGARYAIAIRNRLGGRILAVTAVDGVNVISGDTAGWDQTGYVFGPGEGYEIDGWRKSNAEITAFEFTEATGSYAARTGRPGNVGVIGVALFRERVLIPRETQSYAAAPEAASKDRAAGSAMNEPLGTGHGPREASNVVQTDFNRAQTEPNELIRLRYDSLENLLAMGVIRQVSPIESSPEAFPESPLSRFVPDPPERR